MSCLTLLIVALVAADPAPLDKSWYAPHELLPLLAQRDGIRWAMPEMLAGRAEVGGDISSAAALDLACKQWGFAWTEAHGIYVVHRADDEALKRWTTALQSGDAAAAAWELGWLGDARAIPSLCKALSAEQADIALAAAQAIEILLADVPIGRDERVDAVLPGRASLAAAFPAEIDLLPLLDSPYPPVRAAALRVILGQGGKPADEAKAVTADDRSTAVARVRQQLFFTPPQRDAEPRPPLAAPPADPAAVKAACARTVQELPRLEKESAWEEMCRHAETLAAWSRAGRDDASIALCDLTGTKLQEGWYPGYVQRWLATSSGDRIRAKVKELMPTAARDFFVRGLEESYCGQELVALTGPYLEEQTVCYVTARKAGRQAVDLLVPLAEDGNLAAIDALGVIGGPRAVAALRGTLNESQPRSATLAFRSAKALGRAGSADALDALLAAADSKSLHRRHAVVLFLGHIGGPQAEEKLQVVLERDEPRLVRAAAADALAQIGTPGALAAAEEFRKTDAGMPPLVYAPRNKRFGPDFPVNEWVKLDFEVQAQGWGEIGWNYDPANRLFFRYGGCTGPYNNELTALDLGTEQFIQRRGIELMAGWGDCRPGNGCSAGRTWDPWLKATWIRHGIGGTPNQLGMADYQSRSPAARFCSYDLATDTFRPAAYHQAPYAETATRLVCDWQHGLVLPMTFTHINHETKDWWALDVRAADPHADAAWKDLTNPEGDYPRWTYYQTAAVDQDAGRLVVYVPAIESRQPETWTYDPAKNIWKNMKPETQPRAQPGGGLVYDPFHKVLLLHSGKNVVQFGGADDAITWSYDVRTNTWIDLKAKEGPGNPWVGAMDFDVEHNVCVLFNFSDKNIYAYRYKVVPEGTRVKQLVER